MRILRHLIAALLCAASLPTLAAIAVGQHTVVVNPAFTNVSTLTTSGVSTSATGSTFVLIVQVKGSISGTTPILDSKGNTYTLKTTNTSGGFGNISQYIYVCDNCTGGTGHTATTNFAAAASGSLNFVEVTGAANPSYDTSTTMGSNSALNTIPGAAITTTNANDLILSTIFTYSGGETINDTAHWNSIIDVTNTVGGGNGIVTNALSDQIETSTGTYQDTYVISLTGDYSGGVTIALKAAGGGGGGGCTHNFWKSDGTFSQPDGSTGLYWTSSGTLATPNCTSGSYWRQDGTFSSN